MDDSLRGLIFRAFRTTSPVTWSAEHCRKLHNQVQSVVAGSDPGPVCVPGSGLLKAATVEQGIPTHELLEDHDLPLWAAVRLHRPRFLSPQTVLITGGLGGVAGQVANRLLSEGHSVILSDIRALSDLQPSEQQRIGLLARSSRLTVSSTDDIPVAAQRLGGRIDAIIHCAGTLKLGRSRDLSPSEIDHALRDKTDSLATAVRQGADLGLNRIIICGSAESRMPHPQFGAYALANEAVRVQAAALALNFEIVVAEWSLWSGVGMGAPSATLARRAGWAVVPPDWGAEAIASMLTMDVGPTNICELALGGPGASLHVPVQGIGGIGGSCHATNANLRRLIRCLGLAPQNFTISDVPHPDGIVRIQVIDGAPSVWTQP